MSDSCGLQPARLLCPWDSPGKNPGMGCHFLLQCMKVKSENWKWSCSVVSDSSRPHGLQPTRLLRPWDFSGKSTGWGAIAFSDGFCAKDPLSLVAYLPSWFSLSSPFLYQTHSALYVCAGAVLKAVHLMNKKSSTDVLRKWNTCFEFGKKKSDQIIIWSNFFQISISK